MLTDLHTIARRYVTGRKLFVIKKQRNQTSAIIHSARSSAIAEGPRGARCVVSIEILPIATQQSRNYLCDKS